jgi:hypothetical protein
VESLSINKSKNKSASQMGQTSLLATLPQNSKIVGGIAAPKNL